MKKRKYTETPGTLSSGPAPKRKALHRFAHPGMELERKYMKKQGSELAHAKKERDEERRYEVLLEKRLTSGFESDAPGAKAKARREMRAVLHPIQISETRKHLKYQQLKREAQVKKENKKKEAQEPSSTSLTH